MFYSFQNQLQKFWKRRSFQPAQPLKTVYERRCEVYNKQRKAFRYNQRLRNANRCRHEAFGERPEGVGSFREEFRFKVRSSHSAESIRWAGENTLQNKRISIRLGELRNSWHMRPSIPAIATIAKSLLGSQTLWQVHTWFRKPYLKNAYPRKNYASETNPNIQWMSDHVFGCSFI